MENINQATQTDEILNDVVNAIKVAEFHLENGDIFSGAELPLDWLTQINIHNLSTSEMIDAVLDKVSDHTSFCTEGHTLCL